MGRSVRRWCILLLGAAAALAGIAPAAAETRGIAAFRPGGEAAAAVQAAAQPSPPSTNAQAAALIDVASGRLLYSKNGDKPMRIASLTKIMTAIVAIERGELSDMVKVGASAYGVEGSSVYLKMDEEISLRHLLYGLMLRSGNDAAVAIAEHVGGSVDGFVMLMNEKAREIGLANTQFRNPHGLDADGHYSTAEDLAKLAAYALKNPVFRDIVKTVSVKVPDPGEKWDRLWRNKNKMLQLYEGADGVKTGYTKAAGRCLVSSATRGGQQLVAVTLNDGTDWLDHKKLLDYGFEHYPLHVIYRAGTVMERSGVASPHSFVYPLSEEERDRVVIEVRHAADGSLDARLGIRAFAEYRLNGETIGRLPFYDADHPFVKRMNSDAPALSRFAAAFAPRRAGEDVLKVTARMLRAMMFDWR